MVAVHLDDFLGERGVARRWCKDKGCWGLVATRAFHVGAYVLTSPSAMVHAVMSKPTGTDEGSVVCRTCHKRQDTARERFQRCSGCHVVYYCSRACQRRDWRRSKETCTTPHRHNDDIGLHAKTCKGYAQWHRTNQDALALLHCCLLVYLVDEETDADEVRSLNRQAYRLLWKNQRAHLKQLAASTQRLSYLRHTADMVLNYLAGLTIDDVLMERLPDVNELALHVLLAHLNDFDTTASLVISPMVPVTYHAIYPVASLMNHACRPNVMALHTMYKDTLHDRRLPQCLRVVRDIQAGDELLLSYVDPMSRMEDRQETLQRTYGFTCTCAYCRPDEHDEQGLARVLHYYHVKDRIPTVTPNDMSMPYRLCRFLLASLEPFPLTRLSTARVAEAYATNPVKNDTAHWDELMGNRNVRPTRLETALEKTLVDLPPGPHVFPHQRTYTHVTQLHGLVTDVAQALSTDGPRPSWDTAGASFWWCMSALLARYAATTLFLLAPATHPRTAHYWLDMCSSLVNAGMCLDARHAPYCLLRRVRRSIDPEAAPEDDVTVPMRCMMQCLEKQMALLGDRSATLLLRHDSFVDQYEALQSIR